MAVGLIGLPGVAYRQVDFDEACDELERMAAQGLVADAVTVYFVPVPGTPLQLISILAANCNLAEARQYLALAIDTIDELTGGGA